MENNDNVQYEQINPRCLTAIIGTKILWVNTECEGAEFTVEVPKDLYHEISIEEMDTDEFNDGDYRWNWNGRPIEVGIRFRGYYGTAYISRESKWEDLLALCHVFEHHMDATVWLEQLNPTVKVWIVGDPDTQ